MEHEFAGGFEGVAFRDEVQRFEESVILEQKLRPMEDGDPCGLILHRLYNTNGGRKTLNLKLIIIMEDQKKREGVTYIAWKILLVLGGVLDSRELDLLFVPPSEKEVVSIW